MELQKILPQYADTETSEVLMQEGAYKSALNIRMSSEEENSKFLVSTMKGNYEIINTQLPAGVNTVIGTHNSQSDKSVIYFVHNSNGNHCIFQFFIDDHLITPKFIKLLEWSGLNFSLDLDKKINGTALIGGILFWTDDFNVPRRLNIRKANPNKKMKARLGFKKKYMYYNSGSGSGYDYVQLEPFRLILSVVYNNTTYTASKVYFSDMNGDNYYTVLNDYVNEINSVFNPNVLIAKIIDDEIVLDFLVDGYFDISFQINNAIISGVSQGLIGWVVYENFYPTPYIDEQFSLHRFTPTQRLRIDIRQSTLVSRKDITLNQDITVMQFAYRFVMYDGEKSTLSPFSIKVLNSIRDYNDFFGNDLRFNLFISEGIFGANFYGSFESYRKIFLSEVRYVELLVNYNNSSNWVIVDKYKPHPQFYCFYTSTSQKIGISDAEATKLFDAIPQKCKSLTSINNRLFLGGNTESYPAVPTKIGFSVKPRTTADIVAKQEGRMRPVGYKRGGQYQFGIVFYDKFGKSSPTYTSDQYIVKIPSYHEEISPNPNGFSLNSFGQSMDLAYIDIEIQELDTSIPIWAYSYQIVRTKEMLSSTWFTFTRDLDNTDGEQYYYRGGYREDVNLNWDDPRAVWLLIKVEYTLAYNYQKGDRLKFVEFVSGYGFDVPIYSMEGKYIRIMYKDLPAPFNMGAEPFNMFFEIYSPARQNSTENTIFYEIGQRMLVAEAGMPNRFFGFRNITSIDDGDVSVFVFANRGGYIVPVFTPPKIPQQSYPHASLPRTTIINDQSRQEAGFFRNFSSIGRPNFVDNAAVTQLRSSIRFSNKFVQNSSINGLSSFEPLNETEMANSGGKITKLVKVDDVLLVLMEKAAYSCYIDMSEVRDLKNEKLLAISDAVVGKPRELEGGYGCTNPESVVVFDTRIEGEQSPTSKAYYYSSVRGEVVRYGRNGTFPISQYDNRNFFYNVRRDIQGSNLSEIKILGSFHPYHHEYNIHLPQTINSAKKTYMFSEQRNKWIGFVSLNEAEAYEQLDTFLISFKNGQVWVHNNTEQNKFYGIVYPSEIRIVCNQNPQKNKIFRNISLESSHIWYAPDIKTEKQLSNLVQDDFNTKEDYIHYALFLRDISNPASVSNPLFNGDELRGKYIEVLLRLNEQGLVINPTIRRELFAVNIGYEISEGHFT